MYRTNADDREEIIEHIGVDEFLSNEQYEYLRELSPPVCFYYIWSVFLDLYNGSKETITYIDIDAYERVQCVKLSSYELELIKKMSHWANSETSKMRGD